MSKNTKIGYDINDIKDFVIDGRHILTIRIVAKRNIYDANGKLVVKKGRLGGYISPNSLSTSGDCWVDKNSVLISREGHTIVDGDAIICNSMIIDTHVGENAYVESSKIVGNPYHYNEIVGDACLKGVDAHDVKLNVGGNAKLDNCKITTSVSEGEKGVGEVVIDGNTKIIESQITPKPHEPLVIIYNGCLRGVEIGESIRPNPPIEK